MEALNMNGLITHWQIRNLFFLAFLFFLLVLYIILNNKLMYMKAFTNGNWQQSW